MTGDTYISALRQAEIIRKAWTPPEADKPKTATLTFKSYSQTWLDERDLKTRTREHYQLLLDGHLVPAFGNMPITSITADDIRTWYAKFGTRHPRAVSRQAATGVRCAQAVCSL